MKKIIIAFFGLLPMVLMAQVDRSKAPDPGPAPQIKIGQPATFTLPNGLKVFVVQNTKLPRVSATLSFNMDGIVEGPKAGLTAMGGQLLRRGTTKMNKEQLDEAVDQLGGDINTSATSASAFSLKKSFPKLFAPMSDVVLRPSLPSSELEKIRRQTLSGLQAAKEDPDAIAQNVVNRVVYGKDHPYGDIETEETISSVKLADIRQYFTTWWKPNNAFLVFVGDISPAEAKALATQHFGVWKRGVVPKPKYNTPQPPAKTYIALVDRPSSVQSNITFAAPVPLKPGTLDVISASVLNNILGGNALTSRLMQNLREKYGFTYGAYSSLNPDRLVGSFKSSASVRNEKTDSAIGQFLYEFNRIRTESLPTDEVGRMKNFLSGSFARSLESPGTIANFALNIAKYNMPADYYQNYLKNLAAVTSENIQSVATKYLLPANMHIVVVGNASEIAKGLEKYGPVRYFNVYGQEIAAPTAKAVDASVTPQSILQKAIDAYGGAAAIAAVKDLSLTGTASVQGMNITVTQKHVVPAAFLQEVSMPGMVIEKKLMKNGQYSQLTQGQAKNIDDKDKEEMNEDAVVFTDAYLLKQPGYQFSLKGIEPVEGKDAYAVQVKTPAGRQFTNYYDVASGLMVKKLTVQGSPQGGQVGSSPQSFVVTTYINDYKTFNGVKIPTRIVNDLGMMKFEITFNDVKVNSGLKAEDIK